MRKRFAVFSVLLFIVLEMFFASVEGKQAPVPQNAWDNLVLRNSPRTAGSQNPSYGEIINETALFYRDFRNTPVCWAEAVGISQLTLGGGAPSEAELDAVRSEDAKKRCLLGKERVASDSPTLLNGSSWNSETFDAHLYFVAGYMQGIADGIRLGASLK
jgi:hypothetical protein